MSEPGRNDPCPCGSGAKYKYCCLRKKKKGAANDNLVGGDGWQRRFAQAINRGFEAARQDEAFRAADIWFDGWQSVRDELPAEVSTLHELGRRSDGERSVVDWFWTFTGMLRSIAAQDADYARRGAEFIEQVLAQFPGESDNNKCNMRADLGLLLAAADRWDEANEEFERLIDEFPDHAAGYVSWADAIIEYNPSEVSKAVDILERAIDRPVEDVGAWDIRVRLQEARQLVE